MLLLASSTTRHLKKETGAKEGRGKRKENLITEDPGVTFSQRVGKGGSVGVVGAQWETIFHSAARRAK